MGKLTDIFERVREFKDDHPIGCAVAVTAITSSLLTILCMRSAYCVKQLANEGATHGMLVEDTSVDIFDLVDMKDNVIGHAVLDAGSLNSKDTSIIGFDMGTNCMLYECIGD